MRKAQLKCIVMFCYVMKIINVEWRLQICMDWDWNDNIHCTSNINGLKFRILQLSLKKYPSFSWRPTNFMNVATWTIKKNWAAIFLTVIFLCMKTSLIPVISTVIAWKQIIFLQFGANVFSYFNSHYSSIELIFEFIIACIKWWTNVTQKKNY